MRRTPVKRGTPFDDRWIASDQIGPNGQPCWIWRAGRSQIGYGKFYHQGRGQYAHRFAFEREYGPIPAQLVIDHLCRNKACVNPAHLEAVTQQVNTKRAYLEDYPDGDPCRKCGSPMTTRIDRGHRSRRCKPCDNAADRARYAARKALAAA